MVNVISSNVITGLIIVLLLILFWYMVLNKKLINETFKNTIMFGGIPHILLKENDKLTHKPSDDFAVYLTDSFDYKRQQLTDDTVLSETYDVPDELPFEYQWVQSNAPKSNRLLVY